MAAGVCARAWLPPQRSDVAGRDGVVDVHALALAAGRKLHGIKPVWPLFSRPGRVGCWLPGNKKDQIDDLVF